MNNSLFKQGVEAVTSALSPLTVGKTKVTLDSIIYKNKGIVTISAIDIVDITDDQSGEIKSVVILNCREYPDSWFYGGTAMLEIANKWIELFGSKDAVNSTLENDEVQLQFVKTMTKKGRPYTQVKYVD